MPDDNGELTREEVEEQIVYLERMLTGLKRDGDHFMGEQNELDMLYAMRDELDGKDPNDF